MVMNETIISLENMNLMVNVNGSLYNVTGGEMITKGYSPSLIDLENAPWDTIEMEKCKIVDYGFTKVIEGKFIKDFYED